MLPSAFGVLEGTRLAAGPPWPCPTDPARPAVLAVFAYLFGFSPGTFQEPESRDSAGQRAFVRRRAGEGRRGGRERPDPRRPGLQDRVADLGCSCPPRARGCIPPPGAASGRGKGPEILGKHWGGPGVQRADCAALFCAPSEPAVIFVCVFLELMRCPSPARGGSGASAAWGPDSGSLWLAGPDSFRKVRESALRTPRLGAGRGGQRPSALIWSSEHSHFSWGAWPGNRSSQTAQRPLGRWGG